MGPRLVWIEAARTIGCLLVVLAHVNIYARAGIETWWPGGVVLVPILSLAVPVFFVIAGYAVGVTSSRGPDPRARAVSRLMRLLLPFLVWNALTLLTLELTGSPAQEPIWEMLTGAWHLYFVFALMQLLVLYHLLLPIISSDRFAVVLSFSLGLTALAYGISEAILWIGGADDGSFEVSARKLFPFWAAFFAIGVWWQRNRFDTNGRRVRIVLGSTIFLAFWIYAADLRLEIQTFGFTPRKQLLLGGLPFQLLGSFVSLSFLKSLERHARFRRVFQPVASLGADTYGVYLSHICVLLLLYRAWQLLGGRAGHWAEVPAFTAATLFFSLALVRCFRAFRMPWATLLLLGERRPRSR